GISYKYDKCNILVGNEYFLKEHNIEVERIDEVGTTIYVIKDKELVGYLVISDAIKKSVKKNLLKLEEFGLVRKFLFSGDNTRLVSVIAKEVGNDTTEILKYTDTIICADIHSRNRSKKLLLNHGAKTVLTLADILNAPVDGSGYHEVYGLYGSNLATDNSVKLFPRDNHSFVEKLSERLSSYSGKKIECMVYGDGAFKDPVGGIWELADPVVSPAYTSGLSGQPNELKLKYLADNNLKDLSGEEASEAMRQLIREKEANLVNKNESLGTTPRRITDLLGSLSDLTSGSGDKGTPIILIQNYFKNYADND
ncbi:MAG: coenzyme F420-0:L-glutamate ligase, partial [Clostridia bacterium]|nr:coenzyme F420-0:L-glutamate ligase [Clostridia bacterium]